MQAKKNYKKTTPQHKRKILIEIGRKNTPFTGQILQLAVYLLQLLLSLAHAFFISNYQSLSTILATYPIWLLNKSIPTFLNSSKIIIRTFLWMELLKNDKIGVWCAEKRMSLRKKNVNEVSWETRSTEKIKFVETIANCLCVSTFFQRTSHRHHGYINFNVE